MSLNPYGDRHEYDIATLLSQFEEYKDAHGEECEYVKCEHRNADYSVLDRQQKAYYLYWRDELSQGRCLKSDRGYTKLRLCEIINSDMPPKDGLKELTLLKNNTRMHGTPEGEILSVMFDYCLIHDLDLPRVWMGKGSVRSFMTVSEIMAYPVNRIGRELMWYLSGGPNVKEDGVDDAKHACLFNDCLETIDRFLADNTGKGIEKTYSEGTVTEMYKVFQYLPYGNNKDYRITYEGLRTDGVFGEFMLGLFTYTRKVLCKEIGGKGPSTPSSFNKEFRGIVDRIAKEGFTPFDRTIKEWRGTDRMSMSSKEKMLVDVGAVLETKLGPADKPKAELIVDENAVKQHVSPHLKNDIERNWKIDVDEPQEYVPSGFTNPDYRSFSEPQRKYYSYWRGLTRKGLYGTIDRGYLWLYLCELANIQDDASKNLAQLMGLFEAYGKADEDNLIGRTCFQYALAHKLPVPSPAVFESNVTACMVMEQYLSGKDTNPDKNLLIFLSGITDKVITREFDEDCVGITCSFLRNAQSKLADTGSSIEAACGIERESTAIPLYENLKYFKEVRKARVSYSNYIYNGEFDDGLANIMKRAHSAVRMKRTGKPVKIDKFTAFGIDGKEIMETTVKDWYEARAVEEIKSKANSLVLDKEAVSGAESALKDVTRMMSTETEEIHEMPAAPLPTKEVSGSWKSLYEALGENERNYLKSALEGNAKAYLKENGLLMSKIEDSINGTAMDHVGDQIVENGIVFEDYAEDARSMLSV